MSHNKITYSLTLATILSCTLAISATSQARPFNRLQCLVDAYPEHLSGVDAHWLYWRDGSKMPLDSTPEGRPSSFKKFLEKSGNHEALSRYLEESLFPARELGPSLPQPIDTILNDVSLRDMVATCYPAGRDSFNHQLPKNFDPGRARLEPFFYKMYGNSEAAVEKRLTRFTWLPGLLDRRLRVTRINEANKAFEAVSRELTQLDPKFLPFLKEAGGTFNWRLIAGTNRRSCHSWGMTIDINDKLSDYWRNGHTNSSGIYPLKNRIPWEIVEIFERHGFVWGGKWYSYDTMHFEYRPELLDPRCAC